MAYYGERLNLDFDIPNETAQIVRVKLGDAYTRYLSIRLFKSGEPYSPPDGCTVKLRCEKRDGRTVERSPYSVDGNTVVFYLSPTSMNVAGKCICDVCLSDGDNVLSSESFFMFVHYSPGYDA